ncbi:lambda family phage portal protein [Bradyrhizobium diazoefficiens]|jgi:lambda family phage portal protein|uniref:phage portal protein n=2 Tax=Bradyrhizobium diazoefficiens TaxID=1355477 RepID=UPI00272DC373|nr:phage portal protein [Bradyrhizobium diazoefficiens]WLA58538.1 phage portal protein [Bradyrhizobium diazoefficiens]
MTGIITRTRNAFRAFTRAFSGYDITGGSGRWPAAYALHAPITQQLAAGRLASRKISHQSENNSLIASIIQHAVTAIVADGPTVRAAHPDADINANLQRAWNSFFQDCSVEGGTSLGGYLSRVARGFYVDGESFTQLVTDPVTMQLKLRILTADQVDSAKTIPSLGMTGDMPMIVAGVEFDATGRRVAFWVLPTPPDSPWASVEPPVRISALDICHVVEPHFPGVPRGISPLTAVAPLAMELDNCIDAAVVKLRTTCLVGMVVRDPNGEMAFDESTDPASLYLEPGATLRLPPGADVSFPPTSEMNTVPEVLSHIERLISAGAGVPAFMATGDFGAINYSAGKLGLATFQRRVKAIQQNHIVAQLLNPIWDRIVLLEVLSGRMRAPDFESHPERYAATFLFPGWPAIDELKKAKADTLAVAAKLRSRQEIISEGGRDPADVDAEIEADPFAADDLSASAGGIASQNETENENA